MYAYPFSPGSMDSHKPLARTPGQKRTQGTHTAKSTRPSHTQFCNFAFTKQGFAACVYQLARRKPNRASRETSRSADSKPPSDTCSVTSGDPRA